MGFSIMKPILGRAPLLRTRAFQFGPSHSVLLTRSLLTSPVLAKEKATNDGKKPPKPRKTKAKSKPRAKKEPKSKPKPKPKPVMIFKKHLKGEIKMPLSSWMNFVAEYTAKNKEPIRSASLYTQEASAQWRAMSPEDKEKYKPSPEEKAKVSEAKKAYRATLEYKRAARKFKVKRARKINPFARFVKEYYDRNSTLTFLEQGHELGAKWRALSESEKDFWRQKTTEENTLKDTPTA
ncbi:hypothetical protein HYPSUDRAFT_55288 [Hypholoma sublateritium FD-334 SS-4]|uniref:HMG box domain-containing protein n=1 Tax=Hypholoma sublateritium (strain FD-334 SS-4) TaxID=945553 RepID=A0A0D2PPH3_HYPSF|nr:hypothetical protein HYPSUDRAFT_55288 [Hypholoma sublateritium FD-334 SS-4]